MFEFYNDLCDGLMFVVDKVREVIIDLSQLAGLAIGLYALGALTWMVIYGLRKRNWKVFALGLFALSPLIIMLVVAIITNKPK